MSRREENSWLPSIFEESFIPTLMRNFTLFDDHSTYHENPNISLWEDDKEVNIEVALPGVDEENIEITENKGILWIKGLCKKEENDTKRKYYYKASQSFSYRVAIPGDIDAGIEPKAIYKNGVLKVSYQKKQTKPSKKYLFLKNNLL